MRQCLLQYVKDNKLKAPFVLSCVGSVTQATLRLANASKESVGEVRHRNYGYNDGPGTRFETHKSQKVDAKRMVMAYKPTYHSKPTCQKHP